MLSKFPDKLMTECSKRLKEAFDKTAQKIKAHKISYMDEIAKMPHNAAQFFLICSKVTWGISSSRV